MKHLTGNSQEGPGSSDGWGGGSVSNWEQGMWGLGLETSCVPGARRGLGRTVYWSARAALIKGQRLGGSDNRNVLAHSSGDWKS